MAQSLAEVGGDDASCQRVANSNTGRHLFELVPAPLQFTFFQCLCQQAADNCFSYAHQEVAIEVQLLDFDGECLAVAKA
ncbi:hypothetical protein [Ferrimonas lipolytica]|uniref:Uncharacterized protein n=1 Tax=Ferrimonas lipolytica TaxID=2724191 RepID=A0A6H1UJ48_9GAMM|nr:hypothetical protein [Ferrimonas lipolytica]QIZ78333.1 hypothetical protein HER31_16365 [Ferrimonas lipolytica]